MTERKGLLTIVERQDFVNIKEKAIKDKGFLNKLFDKILNENPYIARTLSLFATESQNLQQVMKTALYVYAFLDNATRRVYHFSYPEYNKLPFVSKKCLSKLSHEYKEGFEIEMIERLREDNPFIANFIDETLMYGNDPENTLKAATFCYRLLELAALETSYKN